MTASYFTWKYPAKLCRQLNNLLNLQSSHQNCCPCSLNAGLGLSQVISFKTKKNKNELTTPNVRKEVNKPQTDNFDAAMTRID